MQLAATIHTYTLNLTTLHNILHTGCLQGSSPTTYLEAVNTCEELVAMALMGEEWALISASSVKLSMAQSLSMPPRQALNKVLLPGRKSSAHTQSL